ncbi:restriction endonuclease subunit S [Escherichia coli]
MSFELYEYKIEDLGKVITGKTPPSKISDAFSAQGIPFVTPKDMDGRRLIDKTERYLSSQGVEAVRNCLLPQNSIAVSCIGSDMGKTVLLPGESITNQQINAIVVDSEHFDYKYVYYYLSTLQDDFKAIAGGSATPILNKGHFSQFKVSLPVKPVQNKIALILDSLDTKIEVNTEINHTLEQMAQALFKSWFVDFEPVKAKMAVLEAGGSQEDATLAAMTVISGKDTDALEVFEREHPEQYAELKATAELFPSAMQECEGGAIPKGWRRGAVTNVTDKVFSGGTPTTTKSEYWNGEFHWFSSGETRNSVITNTEKTITKLGVEQSSTKESVLGDVLIASAGQEHTRGQTSLNMINTYINQSVVAVRPKNTIFTCWLYMNFRSRYEEMRSISDSHSSRGSLTTKLVSGMPVVIPSENILQKFEKSIFPLFDGVKHSQREIDSLTQLRDTLLPKLLSGEITLPEAEQAVSEVENV